MNEPAPCGRPGCPVPERPPARGLRSVVWEAGTRLRRGHKKHYRDAAALVPGVGDTRFALLDGTAHVYLATTSFAALLESAFHDASPAAPTVPSAVLVLWAEAEVSLTEQVRLIDLRDPALARLGLGRDALVTTSAAHYPCTRRFAEQLHGRVSGPAPARRPSTRDRYRSAGPRGGPPSPVFMTAGRHIARGCANAREAGRHASRG